MDPKTYLSHLRVDGAALATAARKDLDAQVPSCPEWVVRDLVDHTAVVYLHKVGIMEAGGTERPEVAPPDDVEGDEELLALYDAALARLISELESRDPEDEAWTFFGDKRVGFWHRRMALEAAVHRWDAQAATATPEPIDPELASDGIDEMLNVMIPADEVPYGGKPGTVHLHRTDGEGEWVVTLEAGKVPETRVGHEKGDAAVRGSASDLLLYLWRRVTPPSLVRFGDDQVSDDFYAYLAGPGL